MKEKTKTNANANAGGIEMEYPAYVYNRLLLAIGCEHLFGLTREDLDLGPEGKWE